MIFFLSYSHQKDRSKKKCSFLTCLSDFLFLKLFSVHPYFLRRQRKGNMILCFPPLWHLQIYFQFMCHMIGIPVHRDLPVFTSCSSGCPEQISRIRRDPDRFCPLFWFSEPQHIIGQKSSRRRIKPMTPGKSTVILK